MTHFFEVLGPGRYRATDHTRGPWSPRYMHAGPPTALLARACARAVTSATPLLGRIGVEVLAPAPVAEVTVGAQVVKPGSKASLVEAELSHDGHVVMLARAWFLRRDDDITTPQTADIDPPDEAGQLMAAPQGWSRGYLDAIEWRWVSGGFETPGPACIWARPLVELLDTEPATTTQRLLMVADSASGISAVDSPERLLFVNTDLTVHLRREPTGSSVWMAAQTRIDPAGCGVTTGTIGDARGDLASTAQLLFVQPRHATSRTL